MPLIPDISFVIPVYNKAGVLPDVIGALAAQTLDASAEYIFVDDASGDQSRAVLERYATRLPNVTILTNTRNAGPSIRLNEGVAAAKGRYLCLLDADELIVPNAVSTMLRLLRDNGAEMVHGKVIVSDLPAKAIRLEPLRPDPEYAVLEPPLVGILKGRGFVRMSWLVETNVFRAAGGCDPRIFIQDESLPLRLALRATRMIDLQAGVVYAPALGSIRLGIDKAQQHHDRFYAYYNLLHDEPGLPDDIRIAMARRCISTAWKAVRGGTLPDRMIGVLPQYAGAKAGLLVISDKTLERFASAFAVARGIRRSGPPPQADVAASR
jgi:glycosyltransferase involved in cell wall biosynthesis